MALNNLLERTSSQLTQKYQQSQKRIQAGLVALLLAGAADQSQAQSGVNIGATAPSGTNDPTLSVEGNLRVGEAYKLANDAAPLNGALFQGNVGIGTSGADISAHKLWVMSPAGQSPLRIDEGGNIRLRIQPTSGNVIIGSLSNSPEKLRVDGALYFGGGGGSANNVSGTIRWNGTDFEGNTTGGAGGRQSLTGGGGGSERTRSGSVVYPNNISDDIAIGMDNSTPAAIRQKLNIDGSLSFVGASANSGSPNYYVDLLYNPSDKTLDFNFRHGGGDTENLLFRLDGDNDRIMMGNNAHLADEYAQVYINQSNPDYNALSIDGSNTTAPTLAGTPTVLIQGNTADAIANVLITQDGNVKVINGKVVISDLGGGFQLKAPNGACYDYSIDNAGDLVKTGPVSCE